MIFTQKTKYGRVEVLLFSILIVFLTACGDDVSVLNSVYWKNSSVVGASRGEVEMTISGTPGVKWSADIVEGADWCSFNSNYSDLSEITGFITDQENTLDMYCKSNTGAVERQAKISFRFEGEAVQVFVLTQTPSFSAYVETPSPKENAGYQYVTHFTTLNNKKVRNYSICFDKTKKAALWVAYPIHACYLGSAGRTDAWAFDPEIDPDFQADCVSRSYGGSYDRGHQLPSADRLATRDMNAQTFYMSNMTPQLNRLNQDMWANLESKVRSYNCSDTLYVVTGAYFDNSSSSTTTDGSGTRVPLPTHYFKVLLRTVKGSTGKSIAQCDESELKSIGFWVEHRSYGDTPPVSICTSVADIEAKTGFEFFPQVSDNVKQQNNPSQWGF